MLGDGQDLEIRLFEEHLEECDSCIEAMQRLTGDDPLVEAMETSGPVMEQMPDDTILQPLLDRLCRLPQTVPQETPSESEQLTEKPPPAPPPGAAVAEYEILEELGRGGMSIVFRARQVKLNRLVALKMLLDGGHARPEQRARFRVEAEALARLRHPHVVQIFEVGEHQGLPFCVLELVDGVSLADKLDWAPLPAPAAAQLTLLLAQATQAAHQAGIIHRDLKPANVLLSPSEGPLAVALGESPGQRYEPRITDFGLARRLDVETRHTLSGDVMGTPSYMAPEQASGRIHEIGPATDVWALGAILYEMLTGRPPFRGVTVLDTLEQVRFAEPVSPSRIQPKVPRDLETICLKCLHKESHRRYASAADLADDLRRFQAHEAIQARPPGLMERSARWVRRHPAGSVALVAAVLLGLSLVIGLLWHTNRLDRERIAAEQSAEDAEWQRQAAEQSAAEATEQRRAADLQVAYQLLQSGDVFSMGELLDRHRPEADAHQRGFAWRYLERQQRDLRGQWHAHDGLPALLAFTPDGKRLVTASSGGQKPAAKVWDLATGRQLFSTPVASHAAEAAVAALSADGRTLAVFSQLNTVAIWDLTTQAKKASLTFSELRAMALSPDGRWLAVAGPTRGFIWDVAKRRQSYPFDPGGQALLHLAFAPDGRSLAGRTRTHLYVWHLDEGKVRTESRWGPRPQAFAWFPTGSMLATVCQDRELLFVGTQQWERLGGWELPRTGFSTAAFTARGRILTLAADSQLLWWDTERGQVLAVYRLQGQRPCRLAFSADGRDLAVATTDGRVLWMDGRPPHYLERLQPSLAAGTALAFSPDGKTLAAGCSPRGVALLDTATLQVQSRIDAGLQRIGHLAFLPGREGSRSRLLTVGAAGGSLALWGGTSGKLLRQYSGSQTYLPRCLAVSPDGKRAAIGHEGNPLELWDLAAGTYLGLQHGGVVRCVAFSSDGRLLASGGEDGTIKFWDLTARSQPQAPVGQRALGAPVLALSFAPDGQHFLASIEGKGVQVWKHDRGEWVADGNPVLRDRGRIVHLLWSANGRSLFGVEEWRIFCWDFPARALIWNRGASLGSPVTAVTCSRDGKQLALGLSGERVEVWDLASWEVRRLAGQDLAGPVRSVIFTPDGRRLITASAVPARVVRYNWGRLVWDRCLRARTVDAIRAWDLSSGREHGAAPLPEQASFAPPSLAALAPDGALLACGSEDGSIDIWDQTSRRLQKRLFVSKLAQAYLLVPALAPGGRITPRYPEGVRQLAFSPSGRWLAALSTRGHARIWETMSWKEHWTMAQAGQDFTWLVFTAGGQLLTSQKGGLHWWDVAQRKLQRTLDGIGTGGVLCGAFAPDGLRLATATADGRIQLWDLETGKATPLIGHRDRVTALAFAPDGKTLASASWDHSVRLWSAAGRNVGVLKGPRGRVWSLAFSPDGGTLAAGGEAADGSGDVVLWRTDNR
jgi:WD40 repeat protein/serine/threonine protein kinase